MYDFDVSRHRPAEVGRPRWVNIVYFVEVQGYRIMLRFDIHCIGYISLMFGVHYLLEGFDMLVFALPRRKVFAYGILARVNTKLMLQRPHEVVVFRIVSSLDYMVTDPTVGPC